MPAAAVLIRTATEQDAAGILEIYAPIVRETPISFEFEPPDQSELCRRIATVSEFYPWLVACATGGDVLGYAYASRHRERAGYQWAVDTAIYVHPRARRNGLARSLYSVLLEALRRQGFYRAYAGIALPNPASVGLHEAMGFVRVAHYSQVGYKLGAWHDVGWWGLALRPATASPSPPVAHSRISGTADWAALLSGSAAGIRVSARD